jgi:hypothetical protein
VFKHVVICLSQWHSLFFFLFWCLKNFLVGPFPLIFFHFQK